MAAAAFVVNNGKAITAARHVGSTPTQTEPKFIQWGTGTSTALVTDTGIQTTTGTTEARTTGTISAVAGAQGNSKVQVVGTITAIGTPTIAEVALFDTVGTGSPPTGGVCWVHASHGSTVLAAGESIAYTITVDFTP
jgi:hypothetical protein